jgi:outer membrane protein TolC
MINNYQQFFNKFERNNWEIGGSFQVPIFVGSGVKALVGEAESDQKHLQAEMQAARNRISLGVHESYLNLHKADVARELAQADLDLARSQLSIVLAQMNEGRASLRQVEEARFAEEEKWIAFYDAQFNTERARLSVLRETGELRAAIQ